MQFDRSAGHHDLESHPTRGAASVGKGSRRAREDWQAKAALVTTAAACAIHGCCDGESAEEYERWDGMA